MQFQYKQINYGRMFYCFCMNTHDSVKLIVNQS